MLFRSLILPGWGTTINTYMTLINSISNYATVYCLDMPGFGESQEPSTYWNIDDYVEFIIEFIKKQEIKKLDFQWISIYANKCNNLVKEKDRAYGINTMY